MVEIEVTGNGNSFCMSGGVEAVVEPTHLASVVAEDGLTHNMMSPADNDVDIGGGDLVVVTCWEQAAEEEVLSTDLVRAVIDGVRETSRHAVTTAMD